jgi:DNA repair photolyase
MNPDYPTLWIKQGIMNGKPVYEITVREVINFHTAFKHKELCSVATFSLGSACAFSCAYCYVESVVRKHPEIVRLSKELDRLELQFHEVVIVRNQALDVLREQLTTRKPANVDLHRPGVVYSSPLVDCAGNLSQARQTAAACAIIHELTAWDVRLLSKSNLLPEIAKLIPPRHEDRVIYGVSTGTLKNELTASIEAGTALVSKRIESLHWLQDRGHRTFGMICPSLPQNDYDGFAARMAAALRIERCEHVWAEVLNIRGKSMPRTLEALRAARYHAEAEQVLSVCGPGNKPAWEQYARETFLAHTGYIPPSKLRFLQYVTPKTQSWWADHRDQGAVSLGKAAPPHTLPNSPDSEAKPSNTQIQRTTLPSSDIV